MTATLSTMLCLAMLGSLPPGPNVVTTESATLDADGYYATSVHQFRIPFQLDAGRHDVREIRLFVSSDGGKTVNLVAKAAPAAGFFFFKAPRSGRYWFYTQVLDKNDRKTPVIVESSLPGLKVFVKP